MSVKRPEDIIHAENLCALALAILSPVFLFPEEAFEKLESPVKIIRHKTEDVEILRKAGSSWAEISELLGLKNPQANLYSYYRRKEKRKIVKAKKRHW